MNKILKLYKMLNKNSKGKEEADGTVSMGSGTFLWILIGAFVGIGLGYLCYTNADFIDLFGGARMVLTLIGPIVACVILILGFLSLINNMYMSSDIEILITLPFSAVQIAVLRVISFLKMAYGGTLVILVAPCVGLTLGGASVTGLDWAGVISAVILLPPFAVSIAAIVVILLMTFLKALRSRETLRYIGIILAFAAFCAYLFLRGNGGSVSVQDALISAMSVMGDFKYVVPVIGFTLDFIKTGNVLYLLIAIGIALVPVVLFVLIAKAMYLQGAMNMMDAGGGKILSDADLEKFCQKKSTMKTLMNKEFLLTRRNPAYLLQNFIVGALWPFVVAIMMKQLAPVFAGIINEGDFLGGLNIYSFIIYSVFISMVTMIVAGLPMMYQTLAYSSLSREGKDFMIMKQIPVSYVQQLEAKRRMARKIAQLSITGYTVLLMILLSWLMKISFVCMIPPIIMVFLYTEFHTNLNMYLGIRGADINWDSEKKGAEKNSLATIVDMVIEVGIIAVGAGMGMIFLDSAEDSGAGSLYACLGILIALGVVFLIGAVVLKKLIMVEGEKKIRRMRF